MRAAAIILCLAAAACNRAPQPVAFDGALTSDKAELMRHSERLTHVLGCTSCHGEGLVGAQFEPAMTQYGPIYASNLTRALRNFTDGQVEAILRTGVHPARKTVWVMPSELFQHLSDADLKGIVAYMRRLPPAGKPMPPPQFSALDRKEIASGEYKPVTQVVRETKDQMPVDLGPQYALGRYITEVTCAECHGPKLEGHPGRNGGTPDLIVAGGYSRAEFDKLITQGIPVGNRTLRPMMSGVAKYRFSYLTPHERDALYAYLKARAEQS